VSDVTRIAVVTPDVLSDVMAGPAIRALNIAERLNDDHDVTLISTTACELQRTDFRCLAVSGSRALRRAVDGAEVIVVQGYVTYHAPWLVTSDTPLVVDLYDPVHLEQFEQLDGRAPQERQPMLDLTVRVLNEQLLRGDFFLCASEEQRHLWLGHLAALGRVNDLTYRADPSLRSLIDVVPFGMPAHPPVRTGAGLRGTVAGIGATDKVILWAGGIYNWFDPGTVIQAVGQLADHHRDVRLFVLGMSQPNPAVPAMRVAGEARALSDQLGLTDRHVFFNPGWVPYTQRQNFLLDADVGVSTHLDHLETTFAFRTRILDYLWAGLPVVTTEGDAFGALVRAEHLGATVAERDVAGLASALTRLLYDQEAAAATRANVARIRERFSWPRVLAPLTRFCAAPHRAADAGADRMRIARRPVLPTNPAARLVVRGALLARGGGPALVAAKLGGAVRRQLGHQMGRRMHRS
jgi:glycosyltransferase involved in cell wall biosynthesis